MFTLMEPLIMTSSFIPREKSWRHCRWRPLKLRVGQVFVSCDGLNMEGNKHPYEHAGRQRKTQILVHGL